MHALPICLVLALLGCGSSQQRSSAPPDNRLARLGDLLAPPCPAAGIERIALRGTSVSEVERAYGVPVRGDGVTELVGDYMAPAEPSLAVEAVDGRIVRVTLAMPASATAPECDLAAAAQRRLGEPTGGACWLECEWEGDGVRLTHVETRTASYLRMHLEAPAIAAPPDACGPGGTLDVAPVDERPESLPDCDFAVERPAGTSTVNCCYARREDACAAAGCAPDECVTDPGAIRWTRPRCQTDEQVLRDFAY